MQDIQYKDIKSQLIDDGFPIVVLFEEEIGPDAFIRYFNDNRKFFETHLLKKGAILFRGAGINTREKFKHVMDNTNKKFVEYIDGNSPRTKVYDNVYTSTEYDPTQYITQHNELSYSANFPPVIYFCCTIAAETGGESPLADSRTVLTELEKRNPKLVRKVEEHGLIYFRNLHGGKGVGQTWQETFETNDKSLVDRHCEKMKVQTAWKPDGGLKLIQPRKGIITHPITGEKVWFNQMDQFHPKHLGEELYETLMLLYQDEEELPMFIKYGNGEKVDASDVEDILTVNEEQCFATPWESGDFAMIDNILVSHGRRTFTGKREVLISMTGEAYPEFENGGNKMMMNNEWVDLDD